MFLSCPAGGLLLNRALGAADAPALVAAAAEHYRSRGIERYFVHAYADQLSAPVTRALADAGLVRYRRRWAKLLRAAASPPAADREPATRAAEPADAAGAATLFCAAFDVAPALEPVFAAVVGRERWDMFVVGPVGTPVAVGLLYSEGGVGYLAGGATAPGHRGRGYQGALLTARLRRAAERGCRWVASETGEAVHDDPQHSYRNMIRRGFEPVGLRDNYVPAGTVWDHGVRPR